MLWPRLGEDGRDGERVLLVTDAGIPAEDSARLTEAGVEVILA